MGFTAFECTVSVWSLHVSADMRRVYHSVAPAARVALLAWLRSTYDPPWY